MTNEQIDHLVSARNAITDLTDEYPNMRAVNEIDAVLRDVPPGQRADVDALLGRKRDDPDVKWAGRTVYLTTTVDNGVEWDALIEHSTPDTVAEARSAVKHDLEWFGVKQGFKTTCRISIDNVFEEISIYDPAQDKRVVMVQHVGGAVEVAPEFGPQAAPSDYRIANRPDNPNWHGVKAWFDDAAKTPKEE